LFGNPHHPQTWMQDFGTVGTAATEYWRTRQLPDVGEVFSHVRMKAKRTAMGTVANSSKTAGYDKNNDTNALPLNARPV
jgi:hypothetical protein